MKHFHILQYALTGYTFTIRAGNNHQILVMLNSLVLKFQPVVGPYQWIILGHQTGWYGFVHLCV